jgi:hypothetical protein
VLCATGLILVLEEKKEKKKKKKKRKKRKKEKGLEHSKFFLPN